MLRTYIDKLTVFCTILNYPDSTTIPEEIHALEKYVVLSRSERAELFGAVNRTQGQRKLGFQGWEGGAFEPLKFLVLFAAFWGNWKSF